VTHPPGTQSQYRRAPLSSEEKARGEANLAPFVAQMLVARGRFRVSADTPDQVELFQGVARRVSDMLQRPVASYANGREIVITFCQQEAPALALRSASWPCKGWPASGPGRLPPGPYLLTGVSAETPVSSVYIQRAPFTCARRPAVTVPLETGGADTYIQRAIPGSEPGQDSCTFRLHAGRAIGDGRRLILPGRWRVA